MRRSIRAVRGRTAKTVRAMLVPTLIALLTLIPAAAINLAMPEPAAAAIEQRGNATTATTTSENLTISKPTGVTAGDVMIANIAKVGNSLTTPSSEGWTLIDGANLGGLSRYGAVLYRVADASEDASYSFKLGTGTGGAVGSIVAFSGVDTSGSSPFDVPPGVLSVQSSQTTVMATPTTTASANAAVIMFGMAAGSAPTWSGWTTTSPGVLTELYDSQVVGADEASVGAAWATKAATGGTGDGKATLSSSERNAGILIALKPAKPTTLTVSAATGTYGGAAGLMATLSPAIAGKSISFTLNGTAAGTAVTDSTGAASITAASLSGIDAGSYPAGVGATFAGDAECSPSSGTAGLTVNPRDIRVTAHEKGKMYGDPDPSFTFQITLGSLAAGDAFSGALSREAGEDVGTYTVQQGTLALNSNYHLAFLEGNLAISVRNVVVTADDCGKVYGDDDPLLAYQITSGSLADGDAFSGETEREAGEDLGTYAIRQGTLALSSNYDLTFVEGTFTISLEGPATPTVSGISPQSGQPGETLEVVISGSNLTGATAVDFGPGVTVNSFEIESATRLVANITIDPTAEPGENNIVITTPSGRGLAARAFSIDLAEEGAKFSGARGLWLLAILLAVVMGFLLLWWLNRRKRGNPELAPAAPDRPSGGILETADLKVAPAAAPIRTFDEGEMPADQAPTGDAIADEPTAAPGYPADMQEAPAVAADQALEAAPEQVEPEASPAPSAAGQPAEIEEQSVGEEQAPAAAATEPMEEAEEPKGVEETPMAAVGQSEKDTEKTLDLDKAPAAVASRPRKRTTRKAPASAQKRSRTPTKKRKKATG